MELRLGNYADAAGRVSQSLLFITLRPLVTHEPPRLTSIILPQPELSLCIPSELPHCSIALLSSCKGM